MDETGQYARIGRLESKVAFLEDADKARRKEFDRHWSALNDMANRVTVVEDAQRFLKNYVDDRFESLVRRVDAHEGRLDKQGSRIHDVLMVLEKLVPVTDWLDPEQVRKWLAFPPMTMFGPASHAAEQFVRAAATAPAKKMDAGTWQEVARVIVEALDAET
jgi:hypothetical protein